MKTIKYFKLFLAIIAALGSDYCFAQNSNLQEWKGLYEGTMQIYSGGKLQTELPVDLLITEIPNSSRLTWKMTYYEPTGILVKDYQMIPPPDNSNHCILDELDGITLDCYIYGNSISSCFETEGLTICDTYIKQGNFIYMELFGGIYPKEGSPEIKSLEVKFLQTVNLKKMK